MRTPLRSSLVLMLAAAALAGAACTGPRGPAGDDGEPGPTGSPGPTPYIEPDATFILTLNSASIASGTNVLSVFFTLTDDDGVPRSREDMSMNWTAAVLRDDPVTGYPAWSSYFTRFVTGLEGDTNQPTSDSAGTYTEIAVGSYRYDFSVALPVGFEVSKTHRIAVYARRADEGFPDGYEIENDWLDFVPDGSPVTETREIVRTENCNTCHNPLKAHGEFRREVEVCVTCHNPDLVDPDTFDTFDPGSGRLNPLDMKVMVHRIHRASELPSLASAVAANDLGFTFSYLGYNNSEFVIAEVTADNNDAGTALEIEGIVYPEDQRNCTHCHTGGADSLRHRTTVTREACGSCHDTTWFDAIPAPPRMEAHAGGVFTNDATCSACHVADMTAEFDISVPGAHTIPTQSAQLPGLTYTIVSAAYVGTSVTIVFSIENGDGTPVTNLSTGTSSFNAIVNGPTSDYRLDNFYRASIRTISVYDGGSETWSVTLPARTATDPYFPNGPAIPPGSTGTFAVGLEARRTISVPGYGNVTEGGLNPVAYFRVDGLATDPDPRRKVVDTDTCNVCHDRLELHGGQRREVEYCVMCHNPQNTDWNQRPKLGGAGTNVNLALMEDGLEERSIDFRSMIHKIHTGEHLSESLPYLIFGNSNSRHFYDDGTFPGDRRSCTTCHDEDTWLIESVPADALPVRANESGVLMHLGSIVHQPGEAELPPVTAACTACHDTAGARVHAEINTNAAGEESCIVCHGEDREFSVREAHGEE